MALQFSTAKDELAERFRNTGTSSKTRAGEWLNLSMDEIIAATQDWDWLQTEANLSIVAGTQDYTVSTAVGSDVDRIFDVRIESDEGWRLMPITADAADRIYTDEDQITGRPEAYAQWGDDTLTVYPDPDANYTAVVRYYKTVAWLSGDADTPPWPRKWDWVWLLGAQAYGYEFNDDRRAGFARGRFEDGIVKMLAGKSRLPQANIQMRSYSNRRAIPTGSPYPVERFALRG